MSDLDKLENQLRRLIIKSQNLELIEKYTDFLTELHRSIDGALNEEKDGKDNN